MSGSPSAAPSLVTDVPASASPVSPRGSEWIIDARGCAPSALRDLPTLHGLFNRLIDELRLTPVAPAVWHAFPVSGGITGMVVLAESHLACHTFPEYGSICLNVFCCRARDDFDAAALLAETLGAQQTRVRRIEREYGDGSDVRDGEPA